MENVILIAIIILALYLLNEGGLNLLMNHQNKKKEKAKEKEKESNSYSYTSSHTYESNYEKYKNNNNPFRNNPFDDAFENANKAANFVIDLCKDVRLDFSKAPYSDKFLLNEPNCIIGYRFEDGKRTIKIMNNLDIHDENGYQRTKVKLSPAHINLLMNFFKTCAAQAKQRVGRTKFSNSQSSFDKTKYTEEELKWQDMFWKLKEQNDLRIQQLNKISKDNPDRPGLVNEVNVVKRKMKSAYDKSGLKKEKTK